MFLFLLYICWVVSFDDPLTDGYWCLVPSGSPLFYPTLRFSALVVSALPFVPLSSPLMISSLSDVPLKSRCRENREAKCAAKGINLWMTKDMRERTTRKRPFQVFISTNPLFSLQKGHYFITVHNVTQAVSDVCFSFMKFDISKFWE